MASEAALAAALALLQQGVCKQCWKGASLKRPQKRPPVAPIPAMSYVCSQVLECEALSWGVSWKCPYMLAEIKHRKSQKTPIIHNKRISGVRQNGRG